MASFNIFYDALQGVTFVICVLAIPLCSVATLLRFLNTHRSARKISLEDWFAFVALVSLWVHAATAIWTVVILNGRARWQTTELPPEDLILLGQIGYVMQLNFPYNPTFAKFSLLALYYRIFNINKHFVRWVWALAALQTAWFLGIFITRIMFCLPIAKTWDPTLPGSCVDTSLLLAAGETLNAAITFVMVGLAIYMVQDLRLSSSTKWKLRLLFILGGITGVIDIVSIIQAYGVITLNLTYLVLVTVQLVANTICCCAPVYRTIVPKMPFLSSLRSKLSVFSYGSAGGSTKKSSFPTFVTIGGSERQGEHGTPQRSARSDEEWIRLNEPTAQAWVDVENRVRVESGKTRGDTPAKVVHVQKSFQVD